MNDAYECMYLEVEELEEKNLQARAKRSSLNLRFGVLTALPTDSFNLCCIF